MENDVILLALKLKIKDDLFNYHLEEMENLIEAANYHLVTTFIQSLDSIDSKTYLGKGKIEEVINFIKACDVKTIITLDELTPSQIALLNDLTGCEIIDRNMLILEIFERRASAKESILQVKIAKLKYMLPRLVGSRDYMSKSTGSASLATKGVGEKQIDLDRRHIEQRIHKLETELALFKIARDTMKKRRLSANLKIVALVGYTNAGKSTTLNNFINNYNELKNDNKEVYVKDQLFATLESSTRHIKMSDNHEFLLIDTVGFVSNLPHHLVESFKSTLEDILDADLILHIIDASSPYIIDQANTTFKVLHDLKVNQPIFDVYTKIDAIDDMFLPHVESNNESFYISNKTFDGFDNLISGIKKELYKDNHQVNMLIPYDKAKLYDIIKENGIINNTIYNEDGIEIDAIISEVLYNKYHEYINKE